MLTGGDYTKLLWDGALRFIVKEECENVKKCRSIHKDFYSYVRRIKKPSDLNKLAFAKECFLYDPLTFANMLKSRPVLMINGLFDPIIPRQAAKTLWKALEKPKMMWLPAGHASIGFFYKKILKETASFLNK